MNKNASLILSFFSLSLFLLNFFNASLSAFAGSDYVPPPAKNLPEKVYSNVSVDKTADLSPIPNYKGTYISRGVQGVWGMFERDPKYARQSSTEKQRFAAASASQVASASKNKTTGGAPVANCSTEAIVYYANQAPLNFQPDKKGLLYGVKTHTPATRVGDSPGYNSCAIVVHAIMKKAGCRWMKYTASAKAIYDMAYRRGWRPSKVQKPGCIVAWNSKQSGKRPRIGKGFHRQKGQSRGVLYRHVGITTGTWMAMDNTSYFSRPSAFITTRPIRYEAPLFLCPVTNKS